MLLQVSLQEINKRQGCSHLNKIIMIGDSGHSKVIEDCLNSNGVEIIARLDDRYKYKFLDGNVIKGPINLVKDLLNENVRLIISIGSNSVRKGLVERLGLSEEMYAIIKHKNAIVSKSSTVGYGSVILPGAVINASAQIGSHTIINTNSVIEHDCIIGNFTHISPGSVLTGNVKIGEGTHIGAGATIIPGVQIGAWSTIGAGSTVISNIKNRVIAVGVPAKVIKEEVF